MQKTTKGALALGTGVALLLGGAGTFAYWNGTADLGSNTQVAAGNLTIAAAAGANDGWAWQGDGAPFDPDLLHPVWTSGRRLCVWDQLPSDARPEPALLCLALTLRDAPVSPAHRRDRAAAATPGRARVTAGALGGSDRAHQPLAVPAVVGGGPRARRAAKP